MTGDDDVTMEAPTEAPPTTEIGPAGATSDGPLAYSDSTSSMPVIDYEPPRSMRTVWIIALVLAAAGSVAAATFLLGRTTVEQQAVTSATETRVAAPTTSGSPTTPQDELADVKFRAALDANGLPLASPIVAMGRPVCTQLQAGDSLDQVAEHVMTDMQWSWEWAHYFATSAVGAYCPRFEWVTKTGANPPMNMPAPVSSGATGLQPGDSCTELHAVTRDALGQSMWCNPLMTGDHSLHWMYGGPS